MTSGVIRVICAALALLFGLLIVVRRRHNKTE